MKRRGHRNEERQPTAHAKSWEAVLSRSEGGHTRLFLGIAHDVTARATLARIFEPFFQDQTDHKVECEERGDAALGRVESGLTFDVLLTDVLLPGVDGPALAARARQLRPGLPVVFMSGYTADVFGHK